MSAVLKIIQSVLGFFVKTVKSVCGAISGFFRWVIRMRVLEQEMKLKEKHAEIEYIGRLYEIFQKLDENDNTGRKLLEQMKIEFGAEKVNEDLKQIPRWFKPTGKSHEKSKKY